MWRRAFNIYRSRGLSVLVRASMGRLRGAFARPARSSKSHGELLRDKSGIEIGGPSAVFRKWNVFPVYSIVAALDNCDYSINTAWDRGDVQKAVYQFHKTRKPGNQYIAEATALTQLKSGAYDFVLASHMLEHTSNPVAALVEWRRLLKADGLLVLVVPNPRETFDHRRPVTSMDHLIEDFNTGIGEDDLTHLPEILALHDLTRDPDVDDAVSFALRCRENLKNRCMHHHVFNRALLGQLLSYANFTPLGFEEVAPHHLIAIARRQAG